jgi:hypothetical protein
MDSRRLIIANGVTVDLSEYLLKSEAETLYATLDGLNNKQDKLISGTNIKTVNGTSILGSGNITISSDIDTSNLVQAVDTNDVVDDVTVDYATKTYVDGLVGDINSVLESIINGVTLITFTVDATEYQGEEGMTWGEWIDSEYNVNRRFSIEEFGTSIIESDSYSYVGTAEDFVYASDIIQENYNYLLVG